MRATDFAVIVRLWHLTDLSTVRNDVCSSQ
jgi:hypothetical protein